MSDLTPDKYRMYFEARLPGQRIAAGVNASVRCPFHDDKTASLSLNIEKGVWKCHAGCGQGGVVEFEKRFSNCDAAAAWANIGEICGTPKRSLFQHQPEAVYPYVSEDGVKLFEKLRFPGKTFVQRAKDPKGALVYRLDGVRKVLYRLPEVVRASDVIICEGEKDTDRVSRLNLGGHPVAPNSRVAVTTNFDGAGKWRPEYSPFLTGKHVVIFPDNDAPGQKHAQQVAASVFPYAIDVRVVPLPGVAEHGDVSDFLQTHSAEELLALIRTTPAWKPERGSLLIDAPEFLATISPEIDWLVHGVIQRGANGFICADPKVGKSWLAVDLALALALGLPWVGFNVRGPVRTALITREDNPALTRWRMDRLLAGRDRTAADLRDRLYVNTREQSPVFKIDTDELFAPMVAELKAAKSQFVILDVFNRLHSSDENDNTEMRTVLDHLDRLQREVDCGVAVVHHYNKSGEGSLTQRLRGAGAIAGWAEWMIGLDRVDERMRKVQFDIKAAGPPSDVYFRISGEDFDNWSRIERTEAPEPKEQRPRVDTFL
jgi:hypothetical protein